MAGDQIRAEFVMSDGHRLEHAAEGFEGRTMTEPVAGPEYDTALGALAPIVRAEQRRGNRARILIHEFQLRGDPPEVYFRYPMDREALAVEFYFGSRVVEVGGRTAR